MINFCKNKAVLGVFLLLSMRLFLLGQEGKKFYYDDDFPVTAADEYDIFAEIDSIKNNLYYATFYYNVPGNPVKIKGQYSDELLTRKEDSIFTYYKNGHLKSKIFYQNGEETGIAQYYYDNGNKQYEINFDYHKPDRQTLQNFLYLNGWDRDGTIIMKDGNGEVIEDQFVKGNDKSYGKVLNGLRQGEWKKYIEYNKSTFEWEYDKGKITKSVWIDSLGNKKSYNFYDGAEIYLYINKEVGSQLSNKIDIPEINRYYLIWVKFSIDNEGKMDNIRMTKTAPPNFLSEVQNALNKVQLDNSITNERIDFSTKYVIPISLMPN